MRLTKYGHACVAVQKPGAGLLVVDPGTFTPNAGELVLAADAVLVTHEHVDHVDEEAVTAALRERPELRVYGPAAVVDRWAAFPDRVTAVAEGDHVDVGGFGIDVFGDEHALVHPDVPRCANVGYLIDGSLYHPGDAYHGPPQPVSTLLLPTSGPWTKVGEAADYLRAVRPSQVIQIHEAMLSELGQQSMVRFLGPTMLGQVPLTVVPVGESVDV
jgi:L-ascorbate metabolism protein UlaG (beta-lactamase superfamily)